MSGFFNMLLGAGQPSWRLSGASIVDSNPSPSNAQAALRVNNTGTEDQITVALGTVQLGEWITPTGHAPANGGTIYDIRATLQSGDTPTGDSLATWLTLSTTRQWTLDQIVVGSKSCSLLVEIRGESGAVLASGLYTLSAEVI